MMQFLLALLIAFQGVGGKASVGGKAGFGGGATVVSSKAFVKSCFHDVDFMTEGTITCVFGSNVTAGNAVVCGVWWASTTVTLSSVTASSDTFAVNARSVQGNGSTISSATKFSSVGGYTTITATFSSSTADTHTMICHEVSGGASAVDVSNAGFQSNPGHGTDAITSGSFTTTANGDYIFGMMADSNAQGDATNAGTGFTVRVNQVTLPLVSEDRIQASSGAISSTFTDTGAGFTSTLTIGIAIE